MDWSIWPCMLLQCRMQRNVQQGLVSLLDVVNDLASFCLCCWCYCRFCFVRISFDLVFFLINRLIGIDVNFFINVYIVWNVVVCFWIWHWSKSTWHDWNRFFATILLANSNLFHFICNICCLISWYKMKNPHHEVADPTMAMVKPW